MKTNWRPYGVVVALIAALMLAGGAIQADVGSQARMLRVDAKVDGTSVRIEAKASGPFEFTTYRPSDHLFVVDMAGVTSSAPGGARVLKSDVVSSYRVLQYRAGDRAIVRVEVLMRTPVEPRIERPSLDTVELVFEGAVASAAETKPAVTPVKMVGREKKAPASARAASAIHRVDVNRVSQQTQVRVEGNGKLTYEALRLAKPDRLVLDFAGARPVMAQKNVKVSMDPVSGVRVGQFKPGTARVVIDLERSAAYSVTLDGNALVVAFGGNPVADKPAAQPTMSAEAVKTAPAPVETKPVETSRVEPKTEAAATNHEPPAPARVEAPATVETPVAETPKPTSEVTPVEPMALPKSLTDPSAASATPVPPKTQPAAPTSEPAPAPAPVAAQQAAKYSGEPISVNLKDVDLKDFFRLIHEISGLNIVVDPQVKGTLTIVLEDVPWDQALDIVLRNNNLDKQVDGNVLRIATRDTLKKEAEAQRDLAKAQAQAVPQEVHVRTLNYAKASAVAPTLKRFLSERGEILADERSNTLIIRDIPAVFPDVFKLMDQLDRRTQQVEIEARVVSATRTFAREIGTQFGFATTSGIERRNVYGGLPGFTSPISHTGTIPPLVSAGTSQIPLNTQLGATSPTSGFTYIHSSPNFALDFIISAAESKGVGKLLSKPRIITQNNAKATVKQGTRIPIQTVVNNTITTIFIDAVLKLEVTPQITAEGTIFLDVLVENTAIDDGIPRIQGIPALRTQSAESKVLIGDGGTMVIGGVIISSQRTDVAQVPLFGSIPLIGHLFKRTAVSTSSQELLFFLTPRIIPG